MTNQTYQLIAQDGTSYSIGPAGLSLGRNRANDIVIQDLKVSRQHAQILLAEGICWIRDSNSSTGVFVNGKRVSGQQKLNPGDRIQLGANAFQFMAIGGGATGIAVNKKKQMIVWVVGAAILILILAIGLGGGFGVDMSRFISPSETPTEIVAAA